VSRAFVKEDDYQPRPRYSLPDPDSDYYDEAAAQALLEGAHRGDSRSAERATGYRWGEPRLAAHVEKILAEAEEMDDLRTAQLARRFLREVRARRAP
jgi:hypothetical protein